jgi:hypothetical protein
MDRTTYPFPLAVNSSQHSHYHRFLLGVDASVLAPFPKPYCVGSMVQELGNLAHCLDLHRWRKLFSGSFPWKPGFGPAHYQVGNVPAYRPLPPEYSRPARRFGAFDFVHLADPSVSALALVAGDRRVLDEFVKLSDGVCSMLEPAACSHGRGPARTTGRFVAGQFAEPNNRWLMPLLHVHSRVLNLTASREEPFRLTCLDSASLGRAGQRELREWPRRQAEMLRGLGYRASLRGDRAPVLAVEGVSDRLLAAMEAPRIAVLRILERMVIGERSPSPQRLISELPPAVVAAMAEQLEVLVASSLTYFRPRKIGLPSEGPWRSAVREHLACHCPGPLASLDAAATRAKAERYDGALIPTPGLDAAHAHTVGFDPYSCGVQQPCDPELTTQAVTRDAPGFDPGWLAREFISTLDDVNERIVRSGTNDPIVSLRSVLPEIDQLGAGADAKQLVQAATLFNVELERTVHSDREAGVRAVPAQVPRFPLTSLDELFAEVCTPRLALGHEIGGRSL